MDSRWLLPSRGPKARTDGGRCRRSVRVFPRRSEHEGGRRETRRLDPALQTGPRRPNERVSRRFPGPVQRGRHRVTSWESPSGAKARPPVSRHERAPLLVPSSLPRTGEGGASRVEQCEGPAERTGWARRVPARGRVPHSVPAEGFARTRTVRKKPRVSSRRRPPKRRGDTGRTRCGDRTRRVSPGPKPRLPQSEGRSGLRAGRRPQRSTRLPCQTWTVEGSDQCDGAPTMRGLRYRTKGKAGHTYLPGGEFGR